MAQLIGSLVYLFTLIGTFIIAIGLPAALIAAARRSISRRTFSPLLVPAIIAAGLIAGASLGWWLKPFEWSMPLTETFRAGVDSDTYGHELESKAERVALYVLFTSQLGLIAAVPVLLPAIRRSFRRPAAAAPHR